MADVVNSMRMLQLVQILSSSRATTSELARMLDVSTRTINRYLTNLETLEVPLDKDFQNKHFIVPGNCPLCGKEVHHE